MTELLKRICGEKQSENRKSGKLAVRKPVIFELVSAFPFSSIAEAVRKGMSRTRFEISFELPALALSGEGVA